MNASLSSSARFRSIVTRKKSAQEIEFQSAIRGFTDCFHGALGTGEFQLLALVTRICWKKHKAGLCSNDFDRGSLCHYLYSKDFHLLEPLEKINTRRLLRGNLRTDIP